MTEIWKDVPGYENKYQISNLGNVKSLDYKNTKKEKLLDIQINKAGYSTVQLWKNCKVKCCKVHRLVAASFLTNFQNKKCVNHKDGNKQNNNVDNLEWMTHLENEQHAIKYLDKSNAGERNGQAKLAIEEVLNIRYLYKSGLYTKEILGQMYNTSRSNIDLIVTNKRWKHI